jgi:hypothetical protein
MRAFCCDRGGYEVAAVMLGAVTSPLVRRTDSMDGSRRDATHPSAEDRPRESGEAEADLGGAVAFHALGKGWP